MAPKEIHVILTETLSCFFPGRAMDLSASPHNFFFFVVRQPLLGLGFLTVEVSRSHSDTPHLVALLSKSDQLVAETSTSQHTTLTTDSYPCPRRDSNPQSQQESGRRPTPLTTRPLGSAEILHTFILFSKTI